MVSAFRYGFLGTTDVDLRLAYGIMIGAAVSMFALAVDAVEQRHRHPRVSASSSSLPLSCIVRPDG